MLEIKALALIVNLYFESRGIEPKLHGYGFVQVKLVPVPDGVYEHFTDGHFDKIGMLRIAPSHGREVIGQVLDQIGIIQAALYSQLYGRFT